MSKSSSKKQDCDCNSHILRTAERRFARNTLNRKEPSMNADVLSTKVTEGVAV